MGHLYHDLSVFIIIDFSFWGVQIILGMDWDGLGRIGMDWDRLGWIGIDWDGLGFVGELGLSSKGILLPLTSYLLPLTSYLLPLTSHLNF